MRLRNLTATAFGTLILAAGLVAAPSAASAAAATGSIGGTAATLPNLLSANPADTTPQIPLGQDDDGTAYSVKALASIGDTVYMGGWFPTIRGANGSSYSRHNLAAFNVLTGAVTGFQATTDGEVLSIAPSPDGHTLYIAGSFRTVNGASRRGLAAINPSTGALVDGFNAHFTKGNVSWTEYACGRLWASGTVPGSLLTLNPATGANTGYQNVGISGTADTKLPTNVVRFDVSPKCSELTAVGNFRTVGSASRKQVFKLNLGTAHATVSSWYGPAWNVSCAAVFAHYTRAVSYDATGSYVNITTTGAAGPTGVTQYCDSLTRWAATQSSTSKPVWTQKTGGDSLYSVADTGQLVCAGGHNRWADNPTGRDKAGPGAVASPGLLCVSAATGHSVYVTSGGIKYRWVATRSRGIGATALLLMNTSDGHKFMLIGSDTNAGGKLGCSHPGNGIDCTRPTDQPSVAGKVTGCTSNSNFAGCIGLRQEDHAGVGALPML